jgi:hypothetical protein
VERSPKKVEEFSSLSTRENVAWEILVKIDENLAGKAAKVTGNARLLVPRHKSASLHVKIRENSA